MELKPIILKVGTVRLCQDGTYNLNGWQFDTDDANAVYTIDEVMKIVALHQKNDVLNADLIE